MATRTRKNKNWNYEETVAEIEDIIQQIESGALPLEEVFDKFETAVKQIKQCDEFLNKGKEKMNLLIETLEEDLEF